MQFAEFLVKSPPGSKEFVDGLARESVPLRAFVLSIPDLFLDCQSDSCDGMRSFRSVERETNVVEPQKLNFFFLHYQCANCQKTLKHYAIMIPEFPNQTYGYVLKLGEFPPFGPRVPARVVTLIGPDRDLFLKGRAAENHGQGIGAFAYYRRIIVNQKDRFINEVIRAAKRLGAPEDQIQRLETAKKETQFIRSIEAMKGGFPPALLINGHNPLTLLFGPLSEGLHDGTDEECLKLATSIREVMFEMAERVGEALKDKAGLDAAVSEILQSRNPVK